LVIDNYKLDQVYEKHFRTSAKKIMVIDDLADRQHDCDILLDQTHGRDAADYKNLVPSRCKILAGSDYVLLRKDFIQLRSKALEKRCQTINVKRILVSMGGADPQNYTLKALEMIKESNFRGAIDIALGFTATNFESVKNYIAVLPNECNIYANADMPKLIYEADLAIGAAGGSVWERCCLGLPQCIVQNDDNQNFFMSKISSFICEISFTKNSLKIFKDFLSLLNENYARFADENSVSVDSMGSKRAISCIKSGIYEL
jgi:UDP-2,4-diacetamido-2,4,6-trideoxy-beta-L-altropyranose hydrolase